MGHAGEAVLFLLPSEAPYLQLLAGHKVHLQPLGLDPVLQQLPDAEAASVRCLCFLLAIQSRFNIVHDGSSSRGYGPCQ